MSSFHLEPPASQFSSPVSKNESRSVARVEFGGEKHLPDILAKTDVIKPPRVVHYNTFQTPLENPPGVSVPKAPSFSPPTPIMRSEMPMPQFGKTQQSTAPVSLQFPTISKIQGPQKIATVNYGADSLPSEGGPASLNSVFSKPAEKHSSWLRSIFSKKSETPAQEISFTPPTPPLPRPPQPRPASGTIPQPGITLQPTVPQIPQSPTQQKTSDIKMNEPQGGPKKENSNPREEMIDLDNMKIKK